MAIKTFTSGEVLTASDTNTFLANSGLVYVAGGALSGSATNFVGCFSSTYRNYRVIIDNPTNTAAGEFYLRYLQGTTPTSGAGYYWAYVGISSAGAGFNGAAGANVNGFLGWETVGAGGFGAISIDICSPNVGTRTIANVQTTFLGSGAYIGRSGALAWDTTAVFDGLRILSGGGSSLTGNVAIYGYRKA